MKKLPDDLNPFFTLFLSLGQLEPWPCCQWLAMMDQCSWLASLQHGGWSCHPFIKNTLGILYIHMPYAISIHSPTIHIMNFRRHPTITKVSSGPSAFKGTAEQLLCICLSCNIRRLWRFIEIWAAMAVEDIREPWQFNVPRNCTTSESPVFYCLPKL